MNQQLSWTMAVFVPYFAHLVMTILVKGRGKQETFQNKTVEFLIEASILGIGVTGALLGSSEARAALRDNAVAIGFIAMITNLLITGLLINLKELDRIKDNPTKRLRIMMLVASVSLAVNTCLVALVDGLSWKWIFGSVLGVWILPFLLLLIVESTGFGKRPAAPEPATPDSATQL